MLTYWEGRDIRTLSRDELEDAFADLGEAYERAMKDVLDARQSRADSLLERARQFSQRHPTSGYFTAPLST